VRQYAAVPAAVCGSAAVCSSLRQCSAVWQKCVTVRVAVSVSTGFSAACLPSSQVCAPLLASTDVGIGCFSEGALVASRSLELCI
jgi:hypothetical protein